MRDFLDVKFDQFIEDYNLGDDPEKTNWRRFVNYQFFHSFNRVVSTRTPICWTKYVWISQSFRRYMALFFC